MWNKKGKKITPDSSLWWNQSHGMLPTPVYIKDNLYFDQLIWEFGDDKNPNWIHVSYVTHRPNRKKLTIAKRNDGKTRYIHEAHS